MSKENENLNEETMNEENVGETTGTKTEDTVIETESRGKKILKWVVKGAAGVLIFVAGALTGHFVGNGKDEDNSTEETNGTEETEEN